MTDAGEIKEVYGLLGRNIGYSLSPAMHNAAFKHFKIPAEYKLFDIEPDDLEKFFNEEVLTGNLSGFNITVPHKIKIKEIIDKLNRAKREIDHEVKILNAINTVKVRKGKIYAFNTDGKGFYKSLFEDTGFDPLDKDIFVLGAGGAGRTIAFFLKYLSSGKPKKVCMYDVDKSGLSAIIKDSDIIEAEPKKIKECDLIINATPLGTKEGDPAPFDFSLLKQGMVVYDLVYARETELIKYAKQKGLIAINGKGMLINQAVLSFNIWTGKPLEETKKVMEEEFDREMKKRFPLPA